MANRADFLVELGTEELPPTTLKSLSEAFTAGVLDGLGRARLEFGSEVQSYASPRRLAILLPDLELDQADEIVEKLGPAVAAAFDKDGEPSKAALGFARSNGVEFDALERINTEKGERLGYRQHKKGLPTSELLGGIVSEALAKLPIAKRMRWGSSRTEFVRPVQWLVMLLGETTVNCEVMGLSAGNTTKGHRFHSHAPIVIKKAADYERVLRDDGRVIASFEERRASIVEQVQQLASELKGNAVIEEALLDEVTALVEIPAAVAGRFDDAFLSVPKEALIYSMSEHQKYFHLVDDNGHLMPSFITVSNIEATDYSAIISGNERVIRPRLADAAFFFETDKKHSLKTLRDRLKNVVFQKELGTIFEKTERISELAQIIAKAIDADERCAQLAGELCKADLASDMVLEFDKMQGIAGSYYAEHEGIDPRVATAIGSHYLPRYAGDGVPTTGEACAVAIADRLDTMTGIFGIGQEPTGSKDPFALRRAAISIIQIILKNNLRIDLEQLVNSAVNQHKSLKQPEETADKVCNYIFDRFTALYQEQGVKTEIIQAVRSVGKLDVLDFNARITAVSAFVKQPESDALAAANKRVGNILEKSDLPRASLKFDPTLLQDKAEKDLADAIHAKQDETKSSFSNQDYQKGLLALTTLKPAIDEFFDNVMVNAEDDSLKNNRLALLSQLQQMFMQAADISQLAKAKQ